MRFESTESSTALLVLTKQLVTLELSTVGFNWFNMSWAIYAICMDGWFPKFTVMLDQEGIADMFLDT